MRRVILRLVLFLFGLACIPFYSHAIKVPGYIIDKNSDTIHGKIILPVFNQVTGGYIINGFDQDILHLNVSFEAAGKKTFQVLYPDMIRGFGFTYQDHPWFYRSFVLEFNNLFRSDGKRDRFLLLVHHGKVDLYQDIKYVNNSANNNVQETYTVYYYYLYSISAGLHRVEMTDQIRSIQDLLYKVGIDKEFIQELPLSANFKDIKWILDRYDKWSPQ